MSTAQEKKKKETGPVSHNIKRKVKVSLLKGQEESGYGFDLIAATPKDSHKKGLYVHVDLES
jgi:hypothetical protein